MSNLNGAVYPQINNLRLHLNPSGMHLLSKNGMNNKLRYINYSAGLILRQCDGQHTLDEILDHFASLYPQTPDIKETTQDFIQKAVKSGDLILQDKKGIQNPSICGNLNYYTPINGSFEITTRCNEKCQHCYRSCDTVSDETELPLAEVIKLINSLIEHGMYNIEITGGDPLVHPHAEDIILYCLENMGSVSIITNAIKLRNQFVDSLDKYKHKMFWQISIESIDPAIHDKFRGLKGSHEISASKVKYLVEKGHKVRVAANLTPYNINTILDTADFVYNTLGAHEFSVSPILERGRAAEYVNSWGLSDGEKNAFNLKMYDVIEELNTKYPMNLKKERQGPDGSCKSARDTVVISPEGNVRPCVICDQDRLFLGNVMNDSYDSIFGGELAKKLQNISWPDHTKESCANCESVPWCEHCYVRALDLNIDRYNSGKDVCEWITDNHLESIVKSYPVSLSSK